MKEDRGAINIIVSENKVVFVLYILSIFAWNIANCDEIAWRNISPNIKQDNQNDDQQINCSIQLSDENQHHEMIEHIKHGVKLIYIHLVFVSGDDIEKRGMYQPLEWMRVEDDSGMEILKYDERQQILSMTMLKNMFTTLNINLIENPTRCISNLTNEAYEKKIRDFLLLGMKGAEVPLNDQNQKDEFDICQLRFDEENVYFFFSCCHISPHGDTFCEQQFVSKRSFFITLILYLIIAFLPLILALHVQQTKRTLELDCNAFTDHLEYDIYCNQGPILSIPRESLICSNDNPITLHNLLYERMILCECKGPLIKEFCTKEENKNWGYYFKQIGNYWLKFTLFLIMILRSSLYMAVEYSEEKRRNDFITKKVSFMSTFMHSQSDFSLFLSSWICFLLIPILYKTCRNATENMKKLLLASVDDVCEIRYDRIISWSMYILFLIIPSGRNFKWLFVLPFYLIIGIPFCVITLFTYMVPLNRMMAYCLSNLRTINTMPAGPSYLGVLKIDYLYGEFRHKRLQILNNSETFIFKKVVFFHYFILIFYAYIFSAIACLRFVMMYVIYNIIGAVEDWDTYLAFLVFGTWIVIYSQKAWNSYSNVYRIYNREVHYLLMSLLSDRVPNIPSTRHLEGGLLMTSLPDSSNKLLTVLIKDNEIVFRHITIFFDLNNNSYILRKTFEDFRNSDILGDEKVTVKAFSHFRFFAFVSFLILLIFLIAQKILKGSNQIVVLMVTGVIPWLYERYQSDSFARILDSVDHIKKKYKDELDSLISTEQTLQYASPVMEEIQQDDSENRWARNHYERIQDSEC